MAMRTVYQVTDVWTEANGTADSATLTVADDRPDAVIVQIGEQEFLFARAGLQTALTELESKLATPQALQAEAVRAE